MSGVIGMTTGLVGGFIPQGRWFAATVLAVVVLGCGAWIVGVAILFAAAVQKLRSRPTQRLNEAIGSAERSSR